VTPKIEVKTFGAYYGAGPPVVQIINGRHLLQIYPTSMPNLREDHQLVLSLLVMKPITQRQAKATVLLITQCLDIMSLDTKDSTTVRFLSLLILPMMPKRTQPCRIKAANLQIAFTWRRPQNSSHAKKTFTLCRQQILQWIVTVMLISFVVITFKICETKGNMTSSEKSTFQVIITALSIGLGLNFLLVLYSYPAHICGVQLLMLDKAAFKDLAKFL
jgi:hypothetical protein